MKAVFEKMFAGHRNVYHEFPKVVRDHEGYELGVAANADDEADLIARGRKDLPVVDLDNDEIAMDEVGAFFVNGAPASPQQTTFIQAARAGAKAAAKLAAKLEMPPDAPTLHPDGTPKRGPGRPSNAEVAARSGGLNLRVPQQQ